MTARGYPVFVGPNTGALLFFNSVPIDVDLAEGQIHIGPPQCAEFAFAGAAVEREGDHGRRLRRSCLPRRSRPALLLPSMTMLLSCTDASGPAIALPPRDSPRVALVPQTSRPTGDVRHIVAPGHDDDAGKAEGVMPRVLVSFLLCSLCAFPSAHADPITLVSLPLRFGVPQPFMPDSLRFFVQYEPQSGKAGPRILDTVFDSSPLPQTISVSGSASSAQPFLALLTNSTEERLELTWELPITDFGQFVGATYLDLFPIDWPAYVVTSLSFTLTEFWFNSGRPIRMPDGRVWFPVELGGMFTVEGTPVAPVPEPASVMLVTVGLAVAIRRYRTRHSLFQQS